MKIALVFMLSFAVAALAADSKPQPVKEPAREPKPEVVKKLGKVTWDLESHKLQWVVQKGTMVGNQFVASSEQSYEVSPDEATMAVSKETRGFGDDEASSLHHLLDVLTLYCAQSVVWWDQGEGTPLDQTVPREPAKHPDSPVEPEKPAERMIRVRVTQPAKAPQPARAAVSQ